MSRPVKITLRCTKTMESDHDRWYNRGVTSSFLPRRVQTMRRLAGMVATTGLALGVPGTAHATTSVTSGLLKCSVTALAPTLSSGKLTGWANVTCNRVTSVEVVLTVVELDGTAEDSQVPIRPASQFVKVTTSLVNKTIKVATGTVTCLSTESDREEYASKAMLNLGGAVSGWDRTAPSQNQFSC